MVSGRLARRESTGPSCCLRTSREQKSRAVQAAGSRRPTVLNRKTVPVYGEGRIARRGSVRLEAKGSIGDLRFTIYDLRFTSRWTNRRVNRKSEIGNRKCRSLKQPLGPRLRSPAAARCTAGRAAFCATAACRHSSARSTGPDGAETPPSDRAARTARRNPPTGSAAPTSHCARKR